MSQPEDLFALKTEGEESDHTKSLSRIRPLSQDEQSESRRAAALLIAVTEDSGLREVLTARDRFEAQVAALEAVQGVQNIKDAGKEVQRAFKAWLSAFRGFDDRTSASLSRLLGNPSPPLSAFKCLTNVEYDTNFAYRICATLRNASEHVSDVINGLSVQVGTDDDGEIFRRVTLQFVGPDLADRFEGMKASVRHDLHVLQSPVEVRDVMNATMISCQRMHYGLLVALRDELEAAVALTTAFHQEAVADGGDWAVFINSDFDPRVDGAKFETRYNVYNLADLAARHLQEAGSLVTEPPLDLTAADLALGD